MASRPLGDLVDRIAGSGQDGPQQGAIGRVIVNDQDGTTHRRMLRGLGFPDLTATIESIHAVIHPARERRFEEAMMPWWARKTRRPPDPTV